jgi:pyruvate dehydrogenase E2 component (dihydrolipoamide acetyltransferase)
MNEIVMPKLSDTMTEGRLVSWKKRVGDTVRRGDVLAEVETDKANMELESFTSGVLLEIKVQPGEMAEVGTVIAVIGKPEEKGAQQGGATQAEQPQAQVQQPQAQAEQQPQPAQQAQAAQQAQQAQPAQQDQPAQQAQPPQQQAQPAQPQEAPQAGQAAPTPAGKGKQAGEAEMKMATAKPGGEGESQAPAAPLAEAGEGQAPVQPGEGRSESRPPTPPPAGQPVGAPSEGAEFRERAAPVVRRKAREMGIDLGQVQGSGPEGRILLHDLEVHQAATSEAGKGAAGAAQPKPAPGREAPQGAAAQPRPAGRTESKPMPRLRAAVAKIVTESWKTIPHFTVTMDIAMDEADSIRRQLKESGHGVTLNDLLVKGVALALQKFAQVNASYADEGMRFHEDINIGVAVGVRDGVLIPVIRGCQQLSLLEISQESRKLVERARAGSLSEQEMSGGTFSISNMGMYGVTQFTAIIYPNQSAVLAVGALMDTVVMRCGVPACMKIMKVTLSADHRVIDGALAAEFLAHLKQILENPVQLLI